MNDTTESSAAQGAAPPIDMNAELANLSAQLAEAEAKAEASRDAHMRALADLDNVRKRTEREVRSARQFGSEKLLGELLGVADSLDLGLAAATKPDAQVATMVEGMQLTRQQLLIVLDKNGVKLVEPKGEPFNPDLHEAVTMVESADVPPGHVLNVLQKGYRLHERLLRPAMVIVAKAPAVPTP
ncbi:MAG: nucleotide exchange factor GrpE [Panacagrimonas sp.]